MFVIFKVKKQIKFKIKFGNDNDYILGYSG